MATIRTVTSAVVRAPITDTPVGREYSTSLVTSRVAPETETGAVSAVRRPASWSWSPLSETTSGSTVTRSTRKPAAGVPVTIGLTGTVLFWRFSYTGIWTWTVVGSSFTPVTLWPKSSTASGATSRSTFTALASMVTLTRASTTRFTSADAPLTSTELGATTVSPTWRPSGGGDWITVTLTCFETFWSSTTGIDCGRMARIVTRASFGRTFTRTLTGFPSGWTPARSTVARKSSASSRPRSAGAMYWICSTSRSWFVMTVSAGWLTGLTGTGPE